jgi:hypothetical protein
MDGAGLDITGLRPLLTSIDSAQALTGPEARKVTSRGAYNIKTDARSRAEGSRHMPHYGRSITYDDLESPMGPVSEVGPDKEKMQGALGNIREFGSPTSAPRPAVIPAIEAELPRFEKAAEDLAVRLLEGR